MSVFKSVNFLFVLNLISVSGAAVELEKVSPRTVDTKILCANLVEQLSLFQSLDELGSQLTLTDVHAIGFRQYLKETSQEELLKLNHNEFFSFSCDQDKLKIKELDSGKLTQIDFSQIHKNQIKVNEKIISITESTDFRSLIKAVQNDSQASVCPICDLLVPRAFAAGEASTLSWTNITNTTSVPGKKGQIRFLLTSLVAASATDIKVVCAQPPGEPTFERLKRRMAFIRSRGMFNFDSYRRVVIGVCDKSVSAKVLAYISGFDDFHFQCTSQGKISKIQFKKADYLDNPSGGERSYQASLNFDYLNADSVRITKTGSFGTCTSKMNSKGEILQIISTPATADYCAADTYYHEFRGSDVASKQLDVKSRTPLTMSLGTVENSRGRLRSETERFDNVIRQWTSRVNV